MTAAVEQRRMSEGVGLLQAATDPRLLGSLELWPIARRSKCSRMLSICSSMAPPPGG